MENLDKDILKLTNQMRGKYEQDIISVNIITIIFALRLDQLLSLNSLLHIERPQVKIKDYDTLVTFMKYFEEYSDNRIYGIFDSLIDEDLSVLVSPKLVDEILSVLITYDFSTNNISVDDFGEFFSALLKKYPITSRGVYEISSNYVSSLFADLASNIEKDNLSVLDPAFGLGFSAIKIIKRNPEKYIAISGYEKSERVYDFARMNLIANGIYEFDLTHGDSLNRNWNGNYDLIITEPPFGEKSNLVVSQTSDTGCDLVLKSLNHLNKNGDAIFLMPSTILRGRGNYSLFRENLVEGNHLREVIILPKNEGATYTNIESCIIILKKDKQDLKVTLTELKKALNGKHQENFIDVDKRTDISIKQISTDNYNLEPKRYLSPVFNLIDDLLKENRAVQLKHLLTPMKKISVENRDIMHFRVDQADLKNDPFDYLLDLSVENDEFDPNQGYKDINSSTGKTSGSGYYPVKNGGLLISRLGRNIKPTLLKPYLGEPTLIKDSIHAYTIDSDKIRNDFLFFQLHSELVQQQLDAYRTGSTIKFITKQDFLSIYIEIPPLNDYDPNIAQERFLNEKKQEALEKLYKQKKSEVEKLSSEIKAQKEFDSVVKDDQEEKIVDYVNHNVRNHLSGVKDSLELLYEFMKEHQGQPINLEALDGVPLENENEKDLSSVDDYFTQSLFGLQKALQSLKNLEDFRLDSFKEEDFEEVNIYNWLESYCEFKNKIKPYSIKVITTESETDLLMTRIVKGPLENVFDNLLTNAEKHGFDGDLTNYNVRFIVELKDNWINIDYLNDGTPMETSFDDYISQGKSGGRTAGTGFGGYFINKTIQKLHGRLTEGENGGPGESYWGVHLRITLPLTVVN